MSFKEHFRELFKPKEVKQAEREAIKINRIAEFQNAVDQEHKAAAEFLLGEISIEEYKDRLKETRPITQIDLRKVADELYKR